MHDADFDSEEELGQEFRGRRSGGRISPKGARIEINIYKRTLSDV